MPFWSRLHCLSGVDEPPLRAGPPDSGRDWREVLVCFSLPMPVGGGWGGLGGEVALVRLWTGGVSALEEEVGLRGWEEES